MIEQELEERRLNRIARLLRESKLPLEKTLEVFDRSRLPGAVGQKLSALLDGSFFQRTENVLSFGNPGSGKTQLLCAIGRKLIHKGYRVLFYTCSLLVQELLIAKRDMKLARILKRFSKYDALIIDNPKQRENSSVFQLFYHHEALSCCEVSRYHPAEIYAGREFLQ